MRSRHTWAMVRWLAKLVRHHRPDDTLIHLPPALAAQGELLDVVEAALRELDG